MNRPRCARELSPLGVPEGRAHGCESCRGRFADELCAIADELCAVALLETKADHCVGHGYWFDRGQLAYVARSKVAHDAALATEAARP
ncbi:MAG: hypothetical protein U0263_39295 [Polyangiaceae bacterium]